jgi:[NiFe] hydrogenase assembly HybE family chaperone
MTDAAAIAERLETCFRQVHSERMDGVPILNEALDVRAVGTQTWNGFWLSILITPWFINVVLQPQESDEETIRTGEKRMFGFPAGSFEFIRGHEDHLGPFWMCSLFSPVFEFTDMETAEAAAEAALTELFEAEEENTEADRDMRKIWRGEWPDAETDAQEEIKAAAEPVAALEDEEDASSPSAFSRRGLLTGKLRETNL